MTSLAALIGGGAGLLSAGLMHVSGLFREGPGVAVAGVAQGLFVSAASRLWAPVPGWRPAPNAPPRP